ncbi:MAG TPA: metal-dependent transcriptional regulator [Nitriliruptorales bacterium]|nr:metal-dependent transcriptional regulator [Nitriliruptorales bacterium]
MHNPLIDSTEMYVRTVYELQEEGIPALRARLTERLGLSAPSVSETVARLEQEGLMRLTSDRTLELTAEGRDLAVSVMRKHRLAERLLVDVIGLEWHRVHAEACRWEHVISDEVERRLVELLGAPATDPHGNPIPDLGEEPAPRRLRSLADAAVAGPRDVRVERLSERLQNDPAMIGFVAEHGLRPGTVAHIEADGDKVRATVADREFVCDADLASLVYVEPVHDA